MPAIFTPSKRGRDVIGRRQILPGKIAFDTTYPTGGYALTLANLKAHDARAIEGCMVIGGNPAANVYKFHWDTTNNKLMAAWTGAAVNTAFNEVAAGTSFAAISVDVVFILV